MRRVIYFAVIILSVACNNSGGKPVSIELIERSGLQDSIFKGLIIVTSNKLPENILNDSLAFLVLPVQASCPSCRKKTIDSIVKYSNRLPLNHYIIISAKGGRKTISGFFREENKELPVIENRLFLDTTNEAYKYDLYDEKPTMYYSYNKKVFKKVAAVPSTVRQDLQEFFSGSRTAE